MAGTKLKFMNGTRKLYINLELRTENTTKKPVFSASATLYRCNTLKNAGQCLDCIPEFTKTMTDTKQAQLLNNIYKLWKKYHLNNMQPWCAHQKYGKSIIKPVQIHHLWGNDEFEKLSKIRELPNEILEVSEQGLKNIPKALYKYSEFDKKENLHIETKLNCWVTYDPVLAPEGLLGRSCPVCGAKYGHGWYYMPIPEKDLKTIKKIIETA